MPKTRDLTGERFGRLVVIGPTEARKNRCRVWRCLCDCGEFVLAPTNQLTSGHKKSCGCIDRERRDDLTGRRFGRLVVAAPTDKRDKSGNVIWHCTCDCGNTCDVGGHELKNGNTKSCGCGNGDNRAKIGARAPHADGTHLGMLAKMEANRDSGTGIRGVHMDKRTGKYIARITLRKKTYWLGSFKDLASAAEARREAELELFEPVLEAHGRDVATEEEYEAILTDALDKEKIEQTREESMSREADDL